jgi:hypothetical protein
MKMSESTEARVIAAVGTVLGLVVTLIFLKEVAPEYEYLFASVLLASCGVYSCHKLMGSEREFLKVGEWVAYSVLAFSMSGFYMELQVTYMTSGSVGYSEMTTLARLFVQIGLAAALFVVVIVVYRLYEKWVTSPVKQVEEEVSPDE